jgi:hypothetical protein
MERISPDGLVVGIGASAGHRLGKGPAPRMALTSLAAKLDISSFQIMSSFSSRSKTSAVNFSICSKGKTSAISPTPSEKIPPDYTT